ncbi:MAG: hypothetical protein KDN05_10485, partial [Verrucomicrobiae bacterium]|nr:hypothetical protein [Verrucomicrobiae bacterium]
MSEESPASPSSQERPPETAEHAETAAPASSKPLPPGVILAFVIIALLGVLIVMNVRGITGGGVSDKDLTA